MFVTVRRSTLLTVGLIAAIGFGIWRLYAVTPVFEAKRPVTVVIDPGHGGADGGAVGASGVLEKDLNLQVALRLKELVEQDGGNAVMTRTEDVSAGGDAPTVREQKRRDLEARRRMAANSGADLFVSIHMNRFSEAKYRGAQVFYSSDEQSRALAESIRAALIPVSEKSEGRACKDAGQTLYVLRDNKLPSVLVECGFLSNPEEEKLLCSDAYRQRLAEAIYRGIADFYEKR